MVERKLLKTKLCELFQKGCCSRPSCTFAHGDAELRRFSRSFSGRQDYRVGDLRDKIGRRRSPINRHSPVRDARASQGYKSPRSYGIKSDRKNRKRQFDSRSDISKNLKISDYAEDRANDRKAGSSDSKEIFDEQLGHVKSEIQVLEDRKTRLKMYLEERAQEADILNSKIEELESQLCKERDECERIISTTQKFIKAHKRHSRMQKELSRSQARLQKLGDQLSSDVVKHGLDEEDANINILSEGEPVVNHVTSPQIDLQKNVSPRNKRQWILMSEGYEQPKQAISAEGEREAFKRKAFRSENLLRSSVHYDHTYGHKEAIVDGNNGWKPTTNETHVKHGKNLPTNMASAVKLKDSENGLIFPSTSMAAHVMDEVLDVETVGNKEVSDNSFGKTEKGGADEMHRPPFQLPPPPPLPRNHHLQYRGENENVDVDVDVDGTEEEMVDVDIV